MYFCTVSVDLKSVRSDAEDVYNKIKKAGKKVPCSVAVRFFLCLFPKCLEGWHFRRGHKEAFLHLGFKFKAELFPYGYEGVLGRTPSALPH